MSCDNCRSDIEQPAVIGLREKAELTVVVTDNVAANPYVAEQTPDNTPTAPTAKRRPPPLASPTFPRTNTIVSG